MTSGARPHEFDAQDITIACAVALLAQLGFVAVFSLPSPALVQADISNDNGQVISVAITPVLKLGSKTPSKLPSQWQRAKPVPPKAKSALPSPQAEKTLEAIPKTHVSDAGVSVIADAGHIVETPTVAAATEDASSAVTAASAQGSEQGAANGTETDPLKARAADRYRAELSAWFAARFQIAGKIPFETLKTLNAVVSVSVTDERKVGGFTVSKPSGDATFDGEVHATLSRIQSAGVELPGPPPNYPEMLGKSLSINLLCNVKKRCE